MNTNQLLRDNNRLRKNIERLEKENRTLIQAVDFLTEALLWASASSDFQVGGEAREGWEQYIEPGLSREIERINKIKEDKKYWNIK